ncbi:unnamed protein product [Cuscuta epithymum]|uniref:Uncharacterized protein n=1 Tax=Cuscuta epithymum TaxID=186058 RepID=A0AAV0EBP6_9ASTE|nr:unnamed protein product [Cuscuta epithymum]
MDGRSRTGQVVDLINLEQNGLHNIMANELKPGISEMVHHVLLPPGEEIINDDHVVTSLNQLIDQMAAHESSSACDHNPHPPPPNPYRNPADPGAIHATYPERGIRRNCFPFRDMKRVRSGHLRSGAEMGKARLYDEESGANEDTNEDEQKPLFS